MKKDKTIRVVVEIDVRGKRDQRCGRGCWALMDPIGDETARCDAYWDDSSQARLIESGKHPGEYMRCKACLDAEGEV